MNLDFHYYGTYAAAKIAGWDNKEAEQIAYWAQFVDECDMEFTNCLYWMKNDFINMQTVMSGMELAVCENWFFGAILANGGDEIKQYCKTAENHIDEIWRDFHFLPCLEKNKEFICEPDSMLVNEMLKYNASDKDNLAKLGMKMHILADTYAHRGFSGIVSDKLNDIKDHSVKGNDIKEMKPMGTTEIIRGEEDNIEQGIYYYVEKNAKQDSLSHLGHGQIGHLPDYSFMVYEFQPQWSDTAIMKNNPAEYAEAFRKMVYTLTYFKKETDSREHMTNELEATHKEKLMEILIIQAADTSEQWENWCMELNGGEIIPKFDMVRCLSSEYSTSLEKFKSAVEEHKKMVSDKVQNTVGD